MADYPNSIPTFTNPDANDPTTAPSHAAQHSGENDEITAIATELGTLPKGSYGTVTLRLDALEASVAGDELVAIDSAATAGYIGAANNDGVLRTGTGLSYTDGGDFITLAVNADYSVITANDGATDVTAAELEILTDGTSTALHNHDHDTLTNYDANDHIDHTTVSITGGTGLTGGGTIDGNQSITLSHLGIEALSDPNADRIVFWDDGAGATEWLVPNTGLAIDTTNLNVTADYSVISGNDGATDVTGAELETLSDGSNADTLHIHTATGVTVSLDDAYNAGNTVDVDGSPITLTVSDTDDNIALQVTQNDVTNDPAGMQVTNSGTGADVVLNATGNGPHINFIGDPTVAAPADGDLWWTGTALNFYDGASTTNLIAATSTLTRGTFTNATLAAGILTITHSAGLAAPYTVMVTIFDNNAKQIIPDDITGATNSVAVDLSSYGTIAGTWGYGYIA